ncbi:N-acetylmuramoyl-L-alanine amidase [Oceanobacillus oncorhynchi]|uniref:peptidoglycan recognition protein family protein n=1 Tax=Oceanobacillus oncorhynchi TaxID=545501 RepID=UPI00186661C1|nr:N-acetylmuramoyl-L-alanine amidase [Oceanobacillus oncorhynchi]
MVQIKNQLISSTPYSHGQNNQKLYVTVHETDNNTRGAGAQNHADLQSNGNARDAAWHWQVDDKIAVKSFDHSFSLWAAGDGSGNGNMNSIHVEICVNADSNYKKACENAAELVKKIMNDEGISASNVVQHNRWGGKHCPRKMHDGNAGVTWSQFKNMIGDASGNTGGGSGGGSTSWTKVTGNWTGQTLGNGEYGEPVKQLQTKLSNNNPPFYPNKGANNNGIDSYFGDNTEDAVRRFQSYYGLDVDGLAGTQVYNQLNGSNGSSGSSGGSSSDVKWVGTDDKGKRLEAIASTVNYYDSQRWSNPTGQFHKGQGWIIDNLYRVNGSLQYRVQNSNGDLYYTTARKDLVKVVG